MPQKIKRVLITAGPTREMLDPVRFLSNLSTGEMGYALARAARHKRYQVTLISGPVSLKPPRGVRLIPVVTVRDMKKACEKWFPVHDALIMTAAICDFMASRQHSHKIHRKTTHRLLLRRTPDVVAGLGKKKGKRIVVGFCLETENWIRQAKEKIRQKYLDGIVANYYNRHHVPFGNRKITTAFISSKGDIQYLRRKTKDRIAAELLGWLESLKEDRSKS